MSKQIILVKGVSIKEFDYIAGTVKENLDKGETRFCVYTTNLEAEIEVIELSDTDEKPYTVHNSYMGTQPDELRAVIYQVVMEVFKELKK